MPPSVIPDTYTYRQGYGYEKVADRTGPYAIDSSGVATLIGSGGGGGGGTAGQIVWTFPLWTKAS